MPRGSSATLIAAATRLKQRSEPVGPAQRCRRPRTWSMFEKFPECATMVVVTAEEEARGLRHAAVGGKHLVLGITKEARFS
jgi:hypothetical protein